MIRKLTKLDHEKIFSFLQEEKAMNLFIIGDIENFGYDTDFQELWGQFDEEGQVIAILLRYYGNYLPYAKGVFDVIAFSEIIQKDKNFDMVSGKQEVVQKLAEVMTFGKKKELFFAEMVDDANLIKEIDLSLLKKATKDDVDSIMDLKDQIEEFQLGANARDIYRQTLETGTGRTYFIEENGLVLACASTTAENSMSAMVVGVCTHSEYRQKGYATLCMIALCQELLNESKTLCLFYDNPAAGAIYKHIGFKDIGRWNMLYAANGGK